MSAAAKVTVAEFAVDTNDAAGMTISLTYTSLIYKNSAVNHTQC